MGLNINAAKLIIEIVDDTTGEIITREATLGDFKEVTKKTTSTRTKKPKDDGNPTPIITVLDNKLQLNNAAVQLTGFEPDQHILIQFEKQGRKVTPVISVNDKGNRLTKTYTISFRGQQRDTLLEYGTVFELIPHEDKDGMFKLKGDAPEKEDDIIDIPEEITNPDESDDLDISEDVGFDLNDVSFTFD